MTKDEALKLALEALELALSSHGVMLLSDPPQDPWKTKGVESKSRQAITAIKEALAQPAQEPFTYYDPVRDSIRPFKSDGDIPLYTTPPQRPWVGLTAQEAAECWTTNATQTWKNFEAKLKDKNA